MKKHSAQNKSFLLFINLIGIPTAIISIALVVILAFNFSSMKNVLKESTSGTLATVARASDSKVTTIVDATSLLEGNSTLRTALSNSENPFESSLCPELQKLKNIYPFLDNIFILNQNTGSVCDVNGVYDIENYFRNIYCQQNYNVAYWKDFRFYNTTDYRILSPTAVSSFGEQKVVIPVIFRRTENLKMKNMIVYTINLQQLIDHRAEESVKIPMNICLLNRYTNEVFLSDGTPVPEDYFPESFYEHLLSETDGSFDYKLKNGNMLVTAYSEKDTSTGYSYFSLINKNLILKQLIPNFLISIAIILFFMIVAFALVFKNAKYIFMPLSEIYKSLSSDSDKKSSGNLIKDIAMRAEEAATSSQILCQTLPCAQEKYLIDYLNATEYYIDDAARSAIRNSLNFQNDYFMVAIVQLSPTAHLFNQYNSAEYSNIQSGFYNIVKEMFAAEFPSFVLPCDQETLYIILNLEKQSETKKADIILNEMNNLMLNDLEYINLSIGKSNAYKGIEGLKLAHKEAADNLTVFSVNADHIVFNQNSSSDFDFGSREESDLFVALLSMNKKRIYEILNLTFERNKGKSNNAQRALYISILNNILKTAKLKNLALPEGKTDEGVMQELNALTVQNMKSFIMRCVDELTNRNEADSSQNTVPTTDLGRSIIDYIEENYTFSGLSIDFLSSYFHTSTASISLTIKNTLGMGFHEYLTTLRVNKAKTLLLTTDEPISSIYSECGFSSQQTFYRSFKKITGQTTSEVRAQKGNSSSLEKA